MAAPSTGGQIALQGAVNVRDIGGHRTYDGATDRTGFLSYVVLRAVGVPEQTARQDYLRSNDFRAAADAKLREQVKQAGYMQNPDLLIPLQEVRDDYLDTAVRGLEQQYGSFGKFLTDGLGIDGFTLVKLRKNLVS